VGEWKTKFPGLSQQEYFNSQHVYVIMACLSKQLQFSELTYILGSAAAWLIQAESFFSLLLVELISVFTLL